MFRIKFRSSSTACVAGAGMCRIPLGTEAEIGHQRHVQRRDANHAAGDLRRQFMQPSRRPFEHQFVMDRSEEHTSELQSLMRTSYAVFCLKKQTKTKTYRKHE